MTTEATAFRKRSCPVLGQGGQGGQLAMCNKRLLAASRGWTSEETEPAADLEPKDPALPTGAAPLSTPTSHCLPSASGYPKRCIRGQGENRVAFEPTPLISPSLPLSATRAVTGTLRPSPARGRGEDASVKVSGRQRPGLVVVCARVEEPTPLHAAPSCDAQAAGRGRGGLAPRKGTERDAEGCWQGDGCGQPCHLPS